jgi:predicted small secreted protein
MMRMLIVKLFVAATLAAGTVTGLSACNTIEGMGEDISALGRGMSRGASGTKDKISK